MEKYYNINDIPDDLRQYFEPVQEIESNHPTIKPLTLTEYISRLIAPPEGIVEERRLLNPCAGIGSEAIGAHLSGGWDVIHAVEQNREYARFAEARWQWWKQFKSIEQAKSAYDGEQKDFRREADGQLRMF